MDAKIKVFFVLTKCLIKNISKQSFIIRHTTYYQLVMRCLNICYSLFFSMDFPLFYFFYIDIH